jgi:seryl-tRNA(Sec) selenium transferase
MRSFPAAGAGLIAYAAKYFGAPNASGFLAGKRELVEAAAQGFIAFEHGFTRLSADRSSSIAR